MANTSFSEDVRAARAVLESLLPPNPPFPPHLDTRWQITTLFLDMFGRVLMRTFYLKIDYLERKMLPEEYQNVSGWSVRWGIWKGIAIPLLMEMMLKDHFQIRDRRRIDVSGDFRMLGELVRDYVFTFDYPDSMLQIPDDCPICLERMYDRDQVETFCRHKFHPKCLEKWILENKTSCPFCRQQL